MNKPSTADLLACAVAAARAAGDYALLNEHRRSEVTARFAHDVKLKLDVECQQQAESVIRSAFPVHAILGEEGGEEGKGAAPLWIVDPLDGTVNFSHGLPLWCVSIAAQVEGRVVAGAVYAPVLKQLYTAAEDQPSLCNGEPIHVSETRRLDEALALTGLEKSPDGHLASYDVVRKVSAKIQKIRLMGAAALDVCNVACGKADIFFETGIHLWDVAAGGLIVRKAGGREEILKRMDHHRLRYICSNGWLHADMKALL